MSFPSFIVTLNWQYKYLILHKQALYSSGGRFSSLPVTLEGNSGVVVGLYVLVLWWSERCSRDLPAAFQIAHEVKRRLMAESVPSAQGQDQGPLQSILKVTRWSVIDVIVFYVSLWHYWVNPSSPSHQSAGASKACVRKIWHQVPQLKLKDQSYSPSPQPFCSSFVILITLQMENMIKKISTQRCFFFLIVYLIRCWKLRVLKTASTTKTFLQSLKVQL